MATIELEIAPFDLQSRKTYPRTKHIKTPQNLTGTGMDFTLRFINCENTENTQYLSLTIELQLRTLTFLSDMSVMINGTRRPPTPPSSLTMKRQLSSTSCESIIHQNLPTFATDPQPPRSHCCMAHKMWPVTQYDANLKAANLGN